MIIKGQGKRQDYNINDLNKTQEIAIFPIHQRKRLYSQRYSYDETQQFTYSSPEKTTRTQFDFLESPKNKLITSRMSLTVQDRQREQDRLNKTQIMPQRAKQQDGIPRLKLNCQEMKNKDKLLVVKKCMFINVDKNNISNQNTRIRIQSSKQLDTARRKILISSTKTHVMQEYQITAWETRETDFNTYEQY